MKKTEQDEYIIGILKGFILKYGTEEEKEKILSEDNEERESIEINTLVLKPDTPKYIPDTENTIKNRFKSISKEELDNTLFFYDLFDLVDNKCLRQFGLQDISRNDLILNNVKKAFLVMNKKGNILHIVANKEANTRFLNKLLNNTLEYNIKRKNSPVSLLKPTPYN